MAFNENLLPVPNLTAFASEKPATKTGLIRLLWPKISACLDAGHTVRAVHARLQLDGVNIPYSTLCAVVAALRSDEDLARRTAEPSGGERKPQRSHSQSSDPLRNVKRMMESRPGFDYTGTLPDEELFGKEERKNGHHS